MTGSTGATTAQSTVSAAARRSTWAAASLRRPGSRRMLGAGCTVPGCARCPSCLRRGSQVAASMRSSFGCGSRATTVPTRTAEWRGSPSCATARRTGSAMTRVPSTECAAAPTTGRAGSRRRRRRLRRRRHLRRRRRHRRRRRRFRRRLRPRFHRDGSSFVSVRPLLLVRSGLGKDQNSLSTVMSRRITMRVNSEQRYQSSSPMLVDSESSCHALTSIPEPTTMAVQDV